jgi:glucose-1-phosphate thymidylyltransferase
VRATPGCRPELIRPIGIVPAAGLALRLQPLPCSKELLPVRGRPVIDYLLERMAAVPCDEIRVVTRPEKRDVAEHARARGASVVEARPASVGESLRAGAAGLDGERVVVFGFPDTLWEPVDGLARLVARLDDDVDAVLGIFRAAEPARSDVVELDGERVAAIRVKPQQPGSDLVWGCAALRVLTLRALGAEPGLALDRLARLGRVAGVRLEDPFLDVGTPEALARYGISGEA